MTAWNRAKPSSLCLSKHQPVTPAEVHNMLIVTELCVLSYATAYFLHLFISRVISLLLFPYGDLKMWTEENRREVRNKRTGVRIWNYGLNYSMLGREIKFQRGLRRNNTVREGYFKIVRRILGGLWWWKEADLKELSKVEKNLCHYRV